MHRTAFINPGFVLLACIVTSSCAVSKRHETAMSPTRQQSITFHEQVEPILQKHCQQCHHRGGNAPFALEQYDDAKEKGRTIRRVVTERQMPPWGASPTYGKFSNNHSLDDHQIAAIAAWVNAGTPRGNSAKAPLPRKFPSDWEIGQPDATFTTPAFDVPAEGKLRYRYARIKTSFAEDRWVEAMQIRSTAAETVHHVLIFLENVRPSQRGTKRPWRPPFNPISLLQGADPKDWPQWIARYSDLIQRDLMVGTAGGMDGYFMTSSSGNIPMIYPEGRAKLLPAGATLVFQIHYTPSGKPQTSETTLALRFAKQPPREAVDTGAVAAVTFIIPPGAANYTTEATTRFQRDAMLLSLNPHMHVRGKSFRYVAEYPDGRKEILLDVPRFDFNWQLDYIFADPLRLPRGTVLRSIATYDNSPNNPANPDPKKEVYFGIQTEDEMLIGYFTAVWMEPTKKSTLPQSAKQ